jgi:hypothetical protein
VDGVLSFSLLNSQYLLQRTLKSIHPLIQTGEVTEEAPAEIIHSVKENAQIHCSFD